MHQLDLFEIEKKAVIEETGLLKRLRTKHDARPCDPVNLPALLGRNHDWGDAEQASDEFRLRGANEFTPQRGKSERRCRGTTVRCEELTPDCATSRMRL